MAQKQIKSQAVLATTVDGYADLWKSRTAVSAFTIAVLWALDYVKVADSGLTTKGKGHYSAKVLRSFTKATMVNHWTKAGRLDDTGLTAAGLNEVTTRLSDPRYSYRTNLEAVKAMRKGLETGQPVELDGHKFKLGKVITLGDSLFS